MLGERNLESRIREAVRFHGHLGPFLVIGVRMGLFVLKILDPKGKRSKEMHAEFQIPILPPFSCVLDGVQVTTGCTVGNQRLHINNSERDIEASFELAEASKVSVSVNSEIVSKLIASLNDGRTSEELASEVADLPDEILFVVKQRRLKSRES